MAARPFLSKTAQRPRLRELIIFASVGLECLNDLPGECACFFKAQTAPLNLRLCLCSEFLSLSGIGAWWMEHKHENIHRKCECRKA
jgi:hypothetical protein